MKLKTTIISTKFSAKVNTDKEIIKIAEFVILSFGYKLKNRTQAQLIFVPRWIQHLIAHPNWLIIRSVFLISEDEISFKVWHPIPLILALIFIIGLFISTYSNFLFLIPFLFMLYYLTYSIFNQRMIFKKVLSELEKV